MNSRNVKIISIGFHPELLWLRESVLRNAGFDVLTTVDLKEGIAHIERGHCGVLLMCYTLPLLARKRLAENFRSNCPDGRIITVSNQQGPEALIDAIRTAQATPTR